MDDPSKECQKKVKLRDLTVQDNCSEVINYLPDSTEKLFQDQTPDYYDPAHLKYKHLFETAPDAIFIADVETGIILEANHSAAQLLGVPVEQIVGMHQSQLHPADKAETYRAIFRKHIEDGAGCIVEDVYVQHKCGRLMPVQINSAVTQLGSKKVICGIFRDISQQQQLIEELKESIERFKRLSETTSEAVVIHKDGVYIDGNQKLFEMFGYPTDQPERMNRLQIIAPQSRDIVEKNMALKDTGPYEAIGLRADDSQFPIEIHARQTHLGGQVVRIVVIRDLTRQKEMERQLLENENKYRRLYNTAQVALYRNRIDDGKLIECNDAFAELLGYDSVEQCLAECYAEKHMVNPERRMEFVQQLKQDGFLRNYQIEVIRRDGVHIWVEATARLNQEENYVEGAQFDITAAKVLTKAEKKVAALLAQGLGNKQAAKLLKLSVRTIEEHRSGIMRKLHVENIVELAKKARFLDVEIKKSVPPTHG